jgi:hypothetical protein
LNEDTPEGDAMLVTLSFRERRRPTIVRGEGA